MYETPISERFIVASKTCSVKSLSEVISKVFTMIFTHVESFHRKLFFDTCFKKFWVVENSFPIVTKLNKTNIKKKPGSILKVQSCKLCNSKYMKNNANKKH